MSELPETLPGTEASANPRSPAEPASLADRPDEPTEHGDASPADPHPPQQVFHGDDPRRASRRSGWAAAWLALLLILVLAGVAAAPFWTPFVTPLLPWSRYAANRERALTARLAALAKDNAAVQAEIAKLQSAQGALLHRLGSHRLDEDAAALAGLKAQFAGLGQRLDRIAAQPAGLADLKAKIASLGRRLDALAVQPAAPTGLKAQFAGLSRRLDRIAAQVAAQPTADPVMMQKLQQDVASLDRRAGNLADRVAALEARIAAKTRSADQQTALLLALLQMREGIAAAEPFTVPYNAFVTLAKSRPPLVAAATPLAPLAAHGVASRATLARDLAHLADRLATAHPAAPAGDWRERVLDQLRGLVTIRRLDGSGRAPPEAAVAHAQADLANGDLAAAVAAVQTLSGPPAVLARPWLAAAHRRLEAEAALSRLQRMLAASGSQPTAAPQAGAPPADHGPAAAPAGGRSRP